VANSGSLDLLSLSSAISVSSLSFIPKLTLVTKLSTNAAISLSLATHTSSSFYSCQIARFLEK
jgi:hypothetical protein